MRTRKELLRQSEESERKYWELFARCQEAEYELVKLKAEAEDMRKQDGEIRSLHSNVRQLKHDMKNHFMVIASYLNEENMEMAKEYTSEILDKLNTMHSYVETGNSLLNHILNEKLEWARSCGIGVKAEIENIAFGRMKSIDFSALLTNMLDNAIEASMLLGREAGAELQVFIQTVRGYETICVKNKIASSVFAANPHLESTKTEKELHGMGVGKIRTIAEEYGGMVDFYEEEDTFCVKVFIPQ